MKEKDIQSLFGKMLPRIGISGVFELKLIKTGRFEFKRLAKHQEDALVAVNSAKGLYHKISDSLPVFGSSKFMRFTSKKPFDCFFLKEIPAYIALCFYKPRETKRVYIIQIEKYLAFKSMATKKSGTEEELGKLSSYIVEL